MLSHDLTALSERFARYQHVGMEMAPDGVRALVNTLRDLARQADQVEAAAIMPNAKLADCDLPDNVVRIAAVLAKKGVTLGPRPVSSPSTDGGGDAA